MKKRYFNVFTHIYSSMTSIFLIFWSVKAYEFSLCKIKMSSSFSSRQINLFSFRETPKSRTSAQKLWGFFNLHGVPGISFIWHSPYVPLVSTSVFVAELFFLVRLLLLLTLLTVSLLNTARFVFCGSCLKVYLGKNFPLQENGHDGKTV